MLADLDKFSPPFYLFRSSQDCDHCGECCRVVALASGSDQPFILSNIHSLPDELLIAISTVQPDYGKHYSDTARTVLFMNTCPCGAHFSDFPLYFRPGGAFFPHDPEEASCIEIIELPIQGEHKIECSYGMGIGGLILRHGKRVAWDSLTQ